MAWRSFQSRLVVSFLILITLVQVGSLLAVNSAIERSARAHVSAELATAAKVVGRLLDARRERLVNAARILSGDFAFKQVVALDDRDTLLSAMDNHRARVAAELMMVVSLDGTRTVDTLRRPAAAALAVPQLLTVAQRAGEVSEAVLVDGRAYQVVVVPLLAPAPIAWIGMGFPIDRALADELRTTTGAHVSFVHTDAGRTTTIASSDPGDADAAELQTLVIPLPSAAGAHIDVVLRSSLAEAMAPYRPLRAALLALVVVSALVSIGGAVWIARDVSRPVRQLAEAARQIEAGRYGATVPLSRQDELGHLATTFNRMTSAVAEREERLRESEERFRAMTESAADAVVTVDAGGLIVSWNRGAQTIFRYTADEAQGMPLARLLPAGASPGAQRGVTKDGADVPVELTLATWQTRQGTFRTAIIRDVTERKQLEDQVRQSQKMESVGRLAGGVAHDFNNLLTVIGGHADLLHAELGPEHPGTRRVQVIFEAATHAGELTRQLLAFSRKQVLAPKILDLGVAVKGIEPMLRRLIGEDIALTTASAPGLGHVEADPTQITQIVLNLAVNARDAMPQGGRLTIETANVELDEHHAHRHADMKPGAYVMLAVSDTGVGMDEETRSHIFEPFFTTKETGKGTGLGLATVYGIVTQSNGTIAVYSEPGRGTTFKIYLPRVEEPADVTTAEAPAADLRGGETIVLVEDNEMLRALACEVLRGSGYTVLEARNGADALEITQRYHGPIHLLLTDVVMPEMGGRELARRLGAGRPDMKVLYMSGYAADAIVHQGVLDERESFIAKPLDAGALLRKLRSLLTA
jgi:signal transduction histidine kinase